MINVNIDELTAAGIPYGNTPGVLNETVAELAFTLIATASRRIIENANFVKDGRWAQRPSNIKGFDLSRRHSWYHWHGGYRRIHFSTCPCVWYDCCVS